MANEVRFDVVATDKASKQLDQVADKAAKLEKLDPTVTVDADTRPADHSVDGLGDQLAKLTASDQVVVLALRAGAAQNELTDLATKLATIDQSDPTLDVTFDRYQQVSGQLDDLKAKIVEIGDTPIDLGAGTGGGAANLETAKNKLHEVGAEADRTKDTVHSMAGNAIGDFAQTATGIGPLGEALGQLTELASGGEASMKELASAGLGLGALSGAMFVVTQLMATFQKSAAEAAKIKAFNVENAQLFAQAAKDGTDAVDAYVTAAQKVGTVKVAPNIDEQTAAIDRMGDAAKALETNQGLITFTKGIQDIGPALIDAGSTAQEFYGSVATGGKALDDFTAKILGSNATAKEQAAILAAVQYQLDQYASGAQSAADQAALFAGTLSPVDAEAITHALRDMGQAIADITPTLADVTAGVGRNDGALTKLAASTRSATVDFRGLNSQLRDANSGTNALTLAYQGLSGTVDHDQSMINLKNQIADVQTAAQNALAAQIEANKATASHAKDAADKQAAAAQATRDYQTAINSLKTDIITLGNTAGENPVNVKADLDKIDANDLAGVEADAEAYFRQHPIDAATRLRVINTLAGGVGQPFATTSSTVVNNNYGPTPSMPSLAAAAAPARWARINGR